MVSAGSWVFADGAPSLHTIDAAIRTARLIDSQGSARRSAEAAYVRDPSGGLYDLHDLRAGERLLIDIGLIHERDGILYPSVRLTDLAFTDQEEARRVLLGAALAFSQPPWLTASGAMFTRLPTSINALLSETISDPEAREAFLLGIAATSNTDNEAIGARGEEFVLAELRNELIGLDRADLAARVQQVSLYTDALGYDITAPRLDGSVRRLEVKTTRRDVDSTCTFFISRNEAEVGARDVGWALVVCKELENRHDVVGWCRGASLAPYLPTDQGDSRWIAARIDLPRHLLWAGMPPAL